MNILSVKATKNRTTRFTVLSNQGFYRVRKYKSKWGLQKGDCFNQLHLGKLTVALEKRKATRSLWAFSWAAEA